MALTLIHEPFGGLRLSVGSGGGHMGGIAIGFYGLCSQLYTLPGETAVPITGMVNNGRIGNERMTCLFGYE